MVDVDGTLALCLHRNAYDWRRADTDTPNTPVISVVRGLAAQPDVAAIIVVSGRHEEAREITAAWLDRHGVPYDQLVLRADGDFRPDDVVKEELFRQWIAPRYAIAGVIDDRDKVVKMWRRIGLVCLQVAEGDF